MDSKGTEIGRIIKHWGGVREIFGGVNDFRVQCKYIKLLFLVSPKGAVWSGSL